MNQDFSNIFGSTTGLDERSLASLITALTKSNLPGFDYLEFKQATTSLLQMGMDEPMAIKSAFATASTVGLTKEKLLSSANHYKEVLNREMQQFDEACKKQIDQKVNGKVTEVEKLRAKIEEYKQKIAQLEEQIQRSQQTIDSADEHIRLAKEKIEATKSSFDHTFQSVMNQIEADLKLIDNVL